MTDDYPHVVTVETVTSAGDAMGDTYGTATPFAAFVNDKNKLVRAASGDQVVSSTQVALPAGSGYFRPGTRVTLPAAFGARVTTVIGCEVADAAGQLPDVEHVVLLLE